VAFFRLVTSWSPWAREPLDRGLVEPDSVAPSRRRPSPRRSAPPTATASRPRRRWRRGHDDVVSPSSPACPAASWSPWAWSCWSGLPTTVSCRGRRGSGRWTAGGGRGHVLPGGEGPRLGLRRRM